MKPYFVRSSIESVTYMEKPLINNPVNLSLCAIFERTYINYQDIIIPVIKFNLISSYAIWGYNNELERDRDYYLLPDKV